MNAVFHPRIYHDNKSFPDLSRKEIVDCDKPEIRKTIDLEEPSLLEMATNFSSAMGRWIKAGFKTVSAEEYTARANICLGCDYWSTAARFGMGKCKASGCGCTTVKFWLATERCPKNKWPEGGQSKQN